MEEYIFNGELFAIVLRNTFDKKGVTFFTKENLSQQLAYMNHPKGKSIQPPSFCGQTIALFEEQCPSFHPLMCGQRGSHTIH